MKYNRSFVIISVGLLTNLIASSCAFKKAAVADALISQPTPGLAADVASSSRAGSDSIVIEVSEKESVKRFFSKQGSVSQSESITTLPVVVPDQIKVHFSLFGLTAAPKFHVEAFGRKSEAGEVDQANQSQIVLSVDPKEIKGGDAEGSALEADMTLSGLRLLLSDNETGEAFVTFYIRNSESGALLSTLIVGLRTPPRASAVSVRNEGVNEFRSRVTTAVTVTVPDSVSVLETVNRAQILTSPNITLHLHRVIEITSNSKDPVEMRVPSQIKGQFSEVRRIHVTQGEGCHQAYSYRDEPRSNETTYYAFQLTSALPLIWTGEFKQGAVANSGAAVNGNPGAGDSKTNAVAELSVFLPKHGDVALIGIYSRDHVEREIPQSSPGYACGMVCDSWNFQPAAPCSDPEAPSIVQQACSRIYAQTSMVCDYCRKGDRGSCSNCQNRDGNSAGMGTFCASGWFNSQSPGTVYSGPESLPYEIAWGDQAIVPTVRWAISPLRDDPEGGGLPSISSGTITW